MDSREITSLRTGAATAVAARYLARPDSRIVTICGCGNQGRVQLKGALHGSANSEPHLLMTKAANRHCEFARELASDLQLSVTAVGDLAAAVRQSDICVTCTPSREAFLGPDDVRPGAFIAAVGADHPEKQELDPVLMTKNKIVCDMLEQCTVMGELHHGLEARVVTRADVHAELGEVVAGKKPGRESEGKKSLSSTAREWHCKTWPPQPSSTKKLSARAAVFE